jgi:hypothetical protein
MALLNVTNIPSDRVPFIDERTGLVSREWYRFLLRLFDITGAGSNTITLEDLQKLPPDALISEVAEIQKQINALEVILKNPSIELISELVSEIAEIQKQINALEVILKNPSIELISELVSEVAEIQKEIESLQSEPLASNFIDSATVTIAPFNIVLTGSPFTYQNTNSYPMDVLVGGTIGGVVKLEFSRGGVTWYDTGSFYGMFTLSPFDYLRITYSTAPTVTGIPR